MSMNNLITNIISYLKYLNSTCKLNVSVHFDRHTFDCIPMHIASMLLPYNCHTNAYCIMTKSTNYDKCLLNQKNLIKKCRKGEGFCHSCYAEVYEYIYPVCKKSDVVGFIAVSGYKRKKPNVSNILKYDLWKSALAEEIPVELCDSVIPPLCIMIEQMLLLCSKEIGNEYNLILQFLTEYHTNITLSDLAEHFNRSKSHISHLFKNQSGMTIRAYCNKLKLEDSKRLLINTDIPITEVALNVGFNDTSYFICLFKETYAITPLKYRKNKKSH